MSYFLDRLQFFKRDPQSFADGHGFAKSEGRDWENSYRARWQYDKVVRSTHGVNCTGSCSWKIYVKNGLVTWETQQTDYPRTRPDLPNHEPRGCPRGASYSWYLYSANRLKYPLIRGTLLRLWREARKSKAPVDAWASIVEDKEKARSYKTRRGMGGFVRLQWEEANEIIAASNLYTVKQYGPDRVVGFSPIPAMSMVSYAAGARYLSLLGGACLSFYDWYCDLPPASPQIWGEQTDVPESADWYNSRYIIAWGSNVPQTRTPDAHFFTEARYNGTKTVAICPDYSELAKLTDHWLHPKQGTDAALAFAFGHVILREFHVDSPSQYFQDYCRQYSDMPMLVRLERRDDGRMNYRGLINMLIMCGCVGQTGGGWAHYVGQEKLRPQTGWQPLAFGLDWSRPPRHMNGTSYFYFNTGQWRYEKLQVDELLSPLADASKYSGSLADLNLRAVRMGWLPCAPQLDRNPLQLVREAEAAGVAPADYALGKFKDGSLDFAFADPDAQQNHPRMMFIWRSNLLGSSGKGHEYMLRHLLGTRHGLQGKDLGEMGAIKPEEVKWRDEAPEGKLDLLVTLDFRMCTTALYSDIVLPTATWYEKDDLNTSDMHPFIHPLSKAVDPAWESRSDWEIFKEVARTVSEMAPGVLGVEKDLVLVPTLHDTPNELGMPFGVADWKKGECEAIPGQTMPSMTVVERDYPNLYRKFTSLGPLLDKLGNGGKGMSWDTKHEVEFLGKLNHTVHDEGVSHGRPAISTAIDAAEVILHLAPETNGHVAVKAWESLGTFTGREHTHLAVGKEHEAIRFRDIQAQPRKIISSPIWSGLEDDNVSYNAGYTNVHELIPWRTVTGRQQFYQDHEWMIDFGEALMGYRPPVNTRTVEPLLNQRPNGNKEIVLNWITPHQKWGIHSTYSDNLIMQTLSRGGPIVWLSEDDARSAGIVDNDWIELFNVNGAIAARAVVSQRVMPGMAMMYHAQERIINVPGSEISGTRGGIHNSVTRIVLKPTHMIGGYAQLAYGFNYYGTCGTNRDEFVIVRKMDKVDWLDDEQGSSSVAGAGRAGATGEAVPAAAKEVV